MEDRDGGDHNQNTFDHRRDIFRLVVSERMVFVWRRRAEADGDLGRDRRGDVYRTFESVRIKRDTTGQDEGGVFQSKNYDADNYTSGGHCRYAIH